MASYNYDAYVAQQEARRSNNPNSGLGPEVQFLSEYLKNDGDVVVVRFPYHSMADLVFETTHAVTFPGKRYPSRVRCTGDASCPFCAQGIKIDTRFFAKLLVYVIDETTNEVHLVNAVWDRPSAFADIDIKNLMQEYGDISNHLFKIKRNGSGTATRYTISIVMNNTVYNPAVYKADFTELAKVDPTKILSKSVAQYNEAVNPSAAQTSQVSAKAPVYNTPPVGHYGDLTTNVEDATQTGYKIPTSTVTTSTNTQPVTQQPTPSTQTTQPAQETPTEQRRPTTRYQF